MILFADASWLKPKASTLRTCRSTKFEPVVRNSFFWLKPKAPTLLTCEGHSTLFKPVIGNDPLFADAFWLIKMHPRLLPVG